VILVPGCVRREYLCQLPSYQLALSRKHRTKGHRRVLQRAGVRDQCTTLPYPLLDFVRWQNVVFERWNTISVRVHRPVTIDVANPPIAYEVADPGEYELAGNGEWHLYSYAADPTTMIVRLPEDIR
jgi:hypothetical protein